mmetsp:Transcript_20701/g.45350  ORF Transcript_20701/g.45350 Transcript_20701/m.45350 type:complete len:226 (-) Transcript_20701:176-853(-)|eukprot:CAMPEP_0118924658 /NCGR_PEP_ID=MMETSP1169-20130426/2693_1 /TAXON_ID=36882 /ORGANISM="Pyramimonas obovata, Strain CCMP722" /LENGTH=225 /DNA_ID=CAMNT_0006865789 /DNA_START=172 /DNA_END=849 /DNA_ORIENTATION=+
MPNFVYSDGAVVQPAKQTSRGQPIPSTTARPTMMVRGGAKGKGRVLTNEQSHLAENSSVWDCMRHQGQMDTDLDKTKKRRNKLSPRVMDEEEPYVPARLRPRDTVEMCLNHETPTSKQTKPPKCVVRDRVVPPWVVPSSDRDETDSASVCSRSTAVSKSVSNRQRSVVEERKSTLPREVKQELMKRVQNLSKELDYETKARKALEQQQQALASQFERVQLDGCTS